ncbi:heavy metal translocating P-type ATPase [Facklamia hominis]|uniref:heavy metal translocating P-type ATPase n=1 Tax=Facklamia hominis TaxID=178214 RepID=UPI000C7D374F|nr:heavy metal translocating P-type ATPase [Facklamia hominis]PKY93178.1 heavy metal translocating P-type ATPase [Facklamia hominis]
MLTYLLKERSGRFVLLGTGCLLAGYLCQFLSLPLVSTLCFYISIFFLGYQATKNAIVDTWQNRQLNVDLLMILAALGACIIGFESEGALLLFIFAVAEVLEQYANDRSSSAITALMSQVPETAQRLLPSGETEEVLTEELKVGDQILIAKGAQISIDGTVESAVEVNEAALTGESVPVHKNIGEEVYAGTVNAGQSFVLKVSKTADQTVFSNIIRMVEEAENRPSKASRFIDKIENKYVWSVLIAVPLFIALLHFGQGLSFQEAFYRGMVFLTVASPCALVASATPATLAAISKGARNGILVKGGAALEALNQMEHLLSDKTGTLTFGAFDVVDYELADELLAEVVFMEQHSTHPIAQAIVTKFKAVDLSKLDRQEEVEELTGSGLRKGSIQIGKPSDFSGFADPKGIQGKLSQSDYTYVLVSKDQQIQGYLALSDQIRPQAKEAVKNFQAAGVTVHMLTGDNEKVAQHVAAELGIDQYQAAMMPEDKIHYVKTGQDKGYIMGMIGDGINDAPALALADISVAMGSGSAVAMESADIVIVKNDLAKLYQEFESSRKLKRIIRENIIFAVGVIIGLVIANFFGWITLPYAVLFHEGSTILVILNGLRMLK